MPAYTLRSTATSTGLPAQVNRTSGAFMGTLTLLLKLVLSKVMERAINDKLLTYLEKNKITVRIPAEPLVQWSSRLRDACLGEVPWTSQWDSNGFTGHYQGLWPGSEPRTCQQNRFLTDFPYPCVRGLPTFWEGDRFMRLQTVSSLPRIQ